MKKLFLTNQRFRFRRFCRRAYAAFCSLKKEVTIGRITAHIADLEMLKAGRPVALATMAGLMAIPTWADAPDGSGTEGQTPQQLSLQEVLVVAKKAEVQSAQYRLITEIDAREMEGLPVQTVADVLHYLPGIDLRNRGVSGSQADVSMRGGTFDQVLILLNGVPLNDAHTGHYSLNLPISADLIESIEVLQGTHAGLYGAFSGAINIRTRDAHANNKERESEGTLRLTAGDNGLINPAFTGSWLRQGWRINTSAEYSRSEGYRAPSPTEKEQKGLDNSDLKMANLYAQLTGKGLNIQLGAQWKDAGAGMYYGFGSQDQFDATRTAFGAASYTHRWGAFSLDADASYRANYDRYEWHRGQRLYGNFHFSQNTSAALRGHYASAIGTTTLGAEFRNENIHSTNLGDTIHADGQVPNVAGFELKDVRVLELVRGTNRMTVNYFAEQTFHYEGLSASLGINGNWNTMFGHHIGGGANIGYRFDKGASLYLNANRSFRMPTFTDLWYNAGNQLGNRNLQPETAWLLSVGSKYAHDFGQAGQLTLQGDWYFRWGKNIIDWVYVAEDTKRPYHAMNQQEVNSTGLELTAHYRYNEWLRRVGISYAYTWMDLDLKEAGSRYLDYLSHKFIVGIEHAFYVWPHEGGTLGANWNLRFQQREGEYNDAAGEVQSYQPVWLLDGSIFYEHRYVRISADCTNMTNRRYVDYGGLLQPGAWVKLTIRAKI